MFIKDDKVYDFLKWLDLLVLPSIGTAYARLAQVWNLPYSEQIPETIMIICALMGAILGISNASYYKSEAGTTNAFMEAYTDFTHGVMDDSKEEE